MLHDIYECPICKNQVEVTRVGGGQLVCCGQPMQLKKAGVSDGAAEKHVPVVEKAEGGFLVKVGSVEHPSTPEHFIEWIELVFTDGTVLRKQLKPGEKPQAFFAVSDGNFTAREYCNLHGLWQAENK